MKRNDRAAPTLIGRRSTWIVGIFVIVAGAIGAVRYGSDLLPGDSKDLSVPTFKAVRGPLLISVSEAGTIQARDQVVIKSEVEGQTTIIFLEEEGKMVNEGDLLVELDASALVDRRVDRDIAVQNAEASFVGARENLAVTQSQAESDIAEAELDYRFAKEDLQQYLEGEYPRLRKEAQSKITLALEELENASETLTWSEKLFAEKYISQSELARDQLTENRARLEHELAVSALELLDEFTHKRKLDELGSQIEQSEMALERVKRKAKADVVQAEATLRAREAEFNRQKDQLARLDDQIKKAKIYAPSPGMVVYATTGRSGWRGNDEPLHEGGSVREREEIVHLPTTNSMMAEVKIHETSLDKVRPGQFVKVTVDALPGRVLAGSVSKIAPLPDAQSVWLNPDLKVYPTEVMLDGEVSEIRTGMNCRAEIIVEQLEDVVYLPIQAVVRIGTSHTVYVRAADGSFEPRQVEIGLDNNHMVHVKSGLEAGEEVLLAPPLDRAATREVQREQMGTSEIEAVPGPMPNEGEGSVDPERPGRRSGSSEEGGMRRPPGSGEGRGRGRFGSRGSGGRDSQKPQD